MKYYVTFIVYMFSVSSRFSHMNRQKNPRKLQKSSLWTQLFGQMSLPAGLVVEVRGKPPENWWLSVFMFHVGWRVHQSMLIRWDIGIHAKHIILSMTHPPWDLLETWSAACFLRSWKRKKIGPRCLGYRPCSRSIMMIISTKNNNNDSSSSSICCCYCCRCRCRCCRCCHKVFLAVFLNLKVSGWSTPQGITQVPCIGTLGSMFKFIKSVNNHEADPPVQHVISVSFCTIPSFWVIPQRSPSDLKLFMLSLPHLCWLHGYTPWLGVITLVMRGIRAGAVASTHLWLDEERQSQQRNPERG